MMRRILTSLLWVYIKIFLSPTEIPEYEWNLADFLALQEGNPFLVLIILVMVW